MQTALRTIAALAAICSMLPAQQPPSAKPSFEGAAILGKAPGTESWIVHFKTRPFTLEAFRAEMYGRRDPAKVKAIVADLERQMKAHQAGFVSLVAKLGGTVTRQWWIVNACCVEIDPAKLGRLEQHANVAYLQPDVEVLPVIKTATNASNHDADALQAIGRRGTGATCAIIDTGHDINCGAKGRHHVTYSKNGSLTQHRLVIQQQVGTMPFDDVHGHGTGVTSIAAGYIWSTSTADHGHSYDANIAGYSIANSTGGGASLSNMTTSYNHIAANAAAYNIVASNLSYSGSSNPLSAEQKAMDSAALNADVVNCTAAGNSGTNVSGSHANINGLSVGAVVENTHTLASFSSRGIQGGRYFPNISANGVSTNMARRDNESSDYIASGTSMASPQVCGAVTQIRAGRSIKSDECRAIMLAGTQANPGSGSTIKVTGVGAGYLHNVQADDIAKNPGQHGRVTLTSNGQTYSRVLAVVPGQTVQAAIAWHRHDVDSTSWSNMDLALYNGATLLVDSDSASNTEELVRWTNTGTTTVSLTMRATLVALGAGATNQTFGWATNIKPGTYTRFGAGCAGSGTGYPDRVLPSRYVSAWGESNNYFPYGRAGMRHQQVFHVNELSPYPFSLGGFAWRDDENASGSAGTSSVTIKIGYTTKSATTLTSSFAGNADSGPLTEVYQGNINFAANAGNTSVSNFATTINFSRPYVVDPARGNILLEVVNNSAGNVYHFFDTGSGASCNTSRVYATSTTATTGSLSLNFGVVHKFKTKGAAPLLLNSGVPTTGKSFTIYCFWARPNSPAILWSGSRVEQSLLGCTLYTTLDAVAAVTVTNSGGWTSTPIGIPSDASLIGARFANQWWIVDPEGAFLNLFAFSNGGEGEIGG